LAVGLMFLDEKGRNYLKRKCWGKKNVYEKFSSDFAMTRWVVVVQISSKE